MNSPMLSLTRPLIFAHESKPLSISHYCAVGIPEHLMPYEAVAKAIFIRANGALAYYKTTGLVE